MNLELYKEYLKAIIDRKMYCTLYNALIDIKNAPYETFSYMIGGTYNVCKGKFTVDKALIALRKCKELADESKRIDNTNEIEKNFSLTEEETIQKTNKLKESVDLTKFDSMLQAIKEIKNAHEYRYDDGPWNYVYRYEKKDTIDVAKRCIKNMDEYLE